MSPRPALRARQLLLLSAGLLGLTAAQVARCPQYPNDVTVANDVDLNRLMGDIGYPYFKPQTPCEVKAVLTPGSYKLVNPVVLANVTLTLASRRLATSRPTCPVFPSSSYQPDVTITAPSTGRMLTLLGNGTVLQARGITFTAGDLSSSAGFFAVVGWGGKKGYDYYQASAGLSTAGRRPSLPPNTNKETNPIHKSDGLVKNNPLYQSAYRGSNYGAVGDDPLFRLANSACRGVSNCDRTGSLSSPIQLMPDDDCDGLQDRIISLDASLERELEAELPPLSLRAAPGRFQPSPSVAPAAENERAASSGPAGRFASVADVDRLLRTPGSTETDKGCGGGSEVFYASPTDRSTGGGRGIVLTVAGSNFGPSSRVGRGDSSSSSSSLTITGDQFGPSARTAREAGSGLATGRRMLEVSSGGLPSGQRCTCPDQDCDLDSVPSSPPVGFHRVSLSTTDPSTGQDTVFSSFLAGLSRATDATNKLRKSVSVVFRSRADQEVCRGPYVGTDPSADIDLGDAAGSAGGLFSVRGGTAIFEACRMTKSSSLLGGALHVTKAGAVRLWCSELSDNAALEDGGAVFLDDSSLLVINSSILRRNQAMSGGAVAAVEGSRVVSVSSTYWQNHARRCGGALALHDEGLSYTETTGFYGNRAENGGAVCVGELSLADFAYSRFQQNVALHSGGALFAEPNTISRFGGSLFDRDTAFFGNDVYSYGRIPFTTYYSADKVPSIDGPGDTGALQLITGAVSSLVPRLRLIFPGLRKLKDFRGVTGQATDPIPDMMEEAEVAAEEPLEMEPAEW